MVKVINGTDIKLSISVEPIEELTLADYDFDVYLVGGGIRKNVLHFSKKGKEGENNASISNGLTLAEDGRSCIVAFNTSDLGLGEVNVQVRARVPDGAFEKRTRTEIVEFQTGIEITYNIANGLS